MNHVRADPAPHTEAAAVYRDFDLALFQVRNHNGRNRGDASCGRRHSPSPDSRPSRGYTPSARVIRGTTAVTRL